MKQDTVSTPTRLEWVDWMKCLGMYFIVAGHFFPFGDNYVYAFSVPLFFLISGFLTKREPDKRTFWKKLFYNLMIPLLLISLINFIVSSAWAACNGTFEALSVIRFVGNVLGGFFDGLGGMWFVYTLIILKVIHHFFNKTSFRILTSLLALLGAYVYNKVVFSPDSNFPHLSNSWINVLTAFPFFAIGVYLGTLKRQINGVKNKKLLLLLLVVCSAVVFFSANANGYVWMYICRYGSNLLLFLSGGLAGSFCVFAISRLLGHAPSCVTLVSKGLILILGFQSYFIAFFRKFFDSSLFDYVWAAVVMVLFVPVIILAERFFPLILGKYRMGKTGDNIH